MELGSTIEQGDGARESHPDIVFAPEALEEIRREAVNGFHAFGHGGLEAGGVLYGTRQDGATRVLASAALKCEHARGPGFVLSAKDQEAFAALLRPPEGMEAVGWYCSHTRRGLDLDANDGEIFDRFFPAPGAIALIVQPQKLGPARATYYSRVRPHIRPEKAGEMLLEPQRTRRPEPATRIPPPAVSEPPEPIEAAPSSEQPHDNEQRHERADRIRPRPKRRSRAWLWVSAVVLLLSAAAAFWWMDSATVRLGLQARAVAPGQVRIEWDRSATQSLNPVSGLLRINDGSSHLSLPLSADQLRTGSVTYVHQSGSITVQLHVERKGANPLDESVQYVGAPAAAQVTPPETQQETEQPPAANTAPPEPQEIRRPDTRSEEPRTAAAPSAPPEQPQATAPPPKKLAPFTPPLLTRSQTGPQAPASLPTAPQATPQASVPQLSLNLPSPVPAPAPPDKPKPSYSGPRSGRIIWTGQLERRGVVEIDGSRSSIGSMTGALPGGVAISFRVSPAEFTSDGLIVYTNDAARNGRVEPAGRGNGWNRTQFEWAPDRAKQLAVLEAPNPSNQFNRIALRNEGRGCSVVVIDWTVQ
jgi:hypothetical protein